MRLDDIIRLRELSCYTDGITWTSPSGPTTPDWYQTFLAPSPIPDDHPPSLRNPIKTKIPTAQDGWHPGDSQNARDQAMADLVEIHKRMRRQNGKPEVSYGALYPIFPNIYRWT